MTIRSPQTPNEFEQYYQLRWEILRKPWQQPKGSEQDNTEDIAYHFAAFDEKNSITGVCRLQQNDDTHGQVRYMAVAEQQQGKGVGKALLLAAEAQARQLSLTTIVLDARENALAFYKTMGYTIVAKAHLLYGMIQHYRMEKIL